MRREDAKRFVKTGGTPSTYYNGLANEIHTLFFTSIASKLLQFFFVTTQIDPV